MLYNAQAQKKNIRLTSFSFTFSLILGKILLSLWLSFRLNTYQKENTGLGKNSDYAKKCKQERRACGKKPFYQLFKR